MNRFKYVVTCILSQINGAGMNTSAACFYEDGDGSLTKTMAVNDLHIAITIFAVLI